METHPLPAWLACLTLAAVQSEGGTVRPRLGGYDLTWADSTTWEHVTFDRQHADATGARLLTLEEPRLRALVACSAYAVPGQTLPILRVGGIPAGIQGIWSLWEIAARDATDQQSCTLLPLFHHDDSRWLDPTARWLWDALLRPSTPITVVESMRGTSATDAYATHRATAEQRGASVFHHLVEQVQQQIAAERDRRTAAFAARRQSLERIGLASVRQARLRDLAQEQSAWMAQLQQRERLRPSLTAVLLVRVEGV